MSRQPARRGVPGVQGFPKVPIEERLAALIEKSADNDCWIWQGHKIYSGYGRFRVHGRLLLAHRFVYEHITGKSLGDLHALHTCDNPSCVNPDHIVPGTHQDNMRDRDSKGRGHAAKITHCKRGHPLSGDNVYRHGNARKCIQCRRLRDRTYYQRDKERMAAS